MIDDNISALKECGLRVTTPRKAVFAILKRSEQPLTIVEIVKQLPATDKVSIYRTIDAFTKHHIVTVVPQGWKPRYELAAPLKPHHHHMHCEACGKLIDIQSSDIEKAITSVAMAREFTIHSHTFELSGLCKECSITRQAL